MILGEYKFNDFTSINPLINKDINETILHETTHMLLTKITQWGNFTYLLTRISKFDTTNKYVLDELCRHSRTVQEGAAVFSECMYVFNKYGYENLTSYLKNLKSMNKTYYNYLKDILRFFNFLEGKDGVQVSSKDLSDVILYICKLALNSDVTNIGVDIFKRKKLLKKFISNNENVEKFIPNKRFKALLDITYKHIVNEKSFDVNNILKLLNKEELREKYNLCFEFDVNMYIDNMKSFILSIYSESPRINQIKKDLEFVVIKEINIVDLPLQSFPESFSKFKVETKDIESIKKLIPNKMGIVFYLADVEFMESMFEKVFRISKYEVNLESIQNSHCCIFYNLEDRICYYFSCAKKELEEIIELYDAIIVSNYKLYDQKNDCLRNISNLNNKNILWCDRTYPNSVNYINGIVRPKTKCSIIQYDGMFLLIIKISEKTILLLPFVGISLNTVLDDIKSRNLNVEHTNTDEVTLLDDTIIKSKEDLSLYDTIINCLFEL